MDEDRQPSIELFELARRGNADALDRLVRRYLAPLRRWAHGRLPPWARILGDTEDLVQDAVLHALQQLPRLRLERQGGLHAYLKTSILNRIRNELRATSRRPPRDELDADLPGAQPSPLDLAITNERTDRYERALARLPQSERDAIIARVEFGLSPVELMAALGKPSVDAARMAVTRAILHLTRILAEEFPSD